MSTRAMSKIEEMLCRELDDIAEKGELSAGTLDTLDKMTHTLKNVHKIMDYEGGYSNAGEWNAYGSYGRNGYSREGDSYGRHYVRGHYSRGRYSMAEGKDMIVDRIEDMMHEPGLSSYDKDVLRHAMEQLGR